jgi:hypothetical protein
MSWASVIAGLLGLVQTVLGLLKSKKLRQEGANEQIRAQQDQVITNVEKAEAAREAVHDTIVREPERLRDDDGFKRPSNRVDVSSNSPGQV